MATKPKPAFATASKIMDSILESVPLEWILPVVFGKILSTIKNPKSPKAKALETSLVEFAKALAKKYPGKICQDEEV